MFAGEEPTTACDAHFAILYGHKFQGNDIEVHDVNLSTCQERCMANATCTGFTIRANEARCRFTFKMQPVERNLLALQF